jgi:hypothetical protein
MSTKLKYVKDYKDVVLKVFLDSGTMLSGKIVDCDEESFVIDKCLVNWPKVISIKPA